MKISVSMLSTYLYCPRLLFLQKVLELEEVPKDVVVLGSVRHEAFDLINKKDMDVVTKITNSMDINAINRLFEKNYTRYLKEVIIKNKPSIRDANLTIMDVFKKSWNSIHLEAKTRSNNVFNFISKYQIYGMNLWNLLSPKIKSEFKIDSDKLQLKGIIDQVHLYENSYVPFELKTGKAPIDGIWPGHRVQIGAYAMLLEEKFKIPVKEGFVHYLDQQKIRAITINEFLKEEIICLTKEVQELLENKSLPEQCFNKNKCKSCSLNSICYDDDRLAIHLNNAKIAI